MKKFWILLGAWLASMVAVAWINNFVLLRIHPLAYYYTPTGMAMSITIGVIESLIIWPLSHWYGKNVMIPALKKGVEKEEIKAAKASYEACSFAYRDFKDRVVTEFKDENE